MSPRLCFRPASALALAAIATVAACGGASADSGAKPADAKGGAANGAPAGGQPGGQGAGQNAGGQQRRVATVVLGPTDIAKVSRGSIENVIPVAGDLRPIETLSLKARLEGNVEQVYVREGDKVAAGAPLARFEAQDFESNLRSAEADAASSKVAAQTAQWNWDQSKDLFKAGAIAERDLRTAEQSAVVAKAQQAAAEARLRAAQTQARDTRIVAPANGTVQYRRVQGGEHVLRGAEMFTFVRSEVLELTASLPAKRANDVKAGQTVRFLADGRPFTGKVARVSPTIDPASRSITAYVQIPNPKGDLKGNTFASGQIVANTLEGVLVVPLTSVKNGTDGKTFVYKIEGGELAQQPVTVGATDDAKGLAEIKDGLKEKDEIVVGTPGTLGRGMKVQVVGNERGNGPNGARGGEARSGGAGGDAGGKGGDRKGGKKGDAGAEKGGDKAGDKPADVAAPTEAKLEKKQNPKPDQKKP